MSVSPTSFGIWLKQQRRQRGLTRQSLAQQLGYSVSLLEKVEAGLRAPTPSLCQAIAHLFEHATTPAPVVAHEVWPKRQHPPAPVMPLIGREVLVRKLSTMLMQPGLVSLVGLGGVGKTRLAMTVASRVESYLAYGALWVDLAPFQHADQLIPALASQLGVNEHTNQQTMVRQMTRVLTGHDVLLVLDNLEHLPGIDAPIRAVLRGKNVRLLATSRQALGLPNEYVVHVHPLPIPDDHTAIAGTAVELFLRHFKRVGHAGSPTSTDLDTIATLCRTLDGLPLAIELAAVLGRTQSLTAIAHGLADRFAVLRDGPRDHPERHQALEATLEWSSALLNPREREVFSVAGAFVGSWSVTVLQAALGHPAWAIDELLTHLARLEAHHLIQRDEQHDRWSQLETVRSYAWMLLGENQDIIRCHQCAWFAMWAEQAMASYSGEQEQEWRQTLALDLPTIRAVLAWLPSSPILRMMRDDEWSTIAPNMLRLGWLLRTQGYYDDARVCFEQVTNAAYDREDHALIVRGLVYCARLAHELGQDQESERLITHLTTAAMDGHDASLRCWIWEQQAHLESAQGHAMSAVSLLHQALTYYLSQEDTPRASHLSGTLGYLYTCCGAGEHARICFRFALHSGLSVTDSLGVAVALIYLAQLFWREHLLQEARATAGLALDLGRSLGLGFLADFLRIAADIALADGAVEDAAELLEEIRRRHLSFVRSDVLLACTQIEVDVRQGRISDGAAVARLTELLGSATTREQEVQILVQRTLLAPEQHHWRDLAVQRLEALYRTEPDPFLAEWYLQLTGHTLPPAPSLLAPPASLLDNLPSLDSLQEQVARMVAERVQVP